MNAPALLRAGRPSATAAGVLRLRGRRLHVAALVAVHGDDAGREGHEAALVSALVAALGSASGSTTARMRTALLAADAALRARAGGRWPGGGGLTAAASVVVADGNEVLLAEVGSVLSFASTADGLPAGRAQRRGLDGAVETDDPMRPPLGRAGQLEPIIQWSRWQPSAFPRGLTLLLATTDADDALSEAVVAALFATPIPRWAAALATAVAPPSAAVVVAFPAQAPAATAQPSALHGSPATGGGGVEPAVDVDAVVLGGGSRGPSAPTPSPIPVRRSPEAARTTGVGAGGAAAAAAIGATVRRGAHGAREAAGRVPWRAILGRIARAAARTFLALFPRRLESRDRTEWSRLLAVAAVVLPPLVVVAALAILARQPGGLGAGFDRRRPNAPADGGGGAAPIGTQPAAAPAAIGATMPISPSDGAAFAAPTVPVATLAPLDPSLDAGMVRLTDAVGIARVQGGDGDARRIVVAGDERYVLNAAAGVVEAVTAAGVLPVLQSGAHVDGQPVGDLIDLAWLPLAGAADGDAPDGAGAASGQVAALDAQGRLWAIEGVAPRALAVAGGMAEGTRAIGGYDGSLYGVDVANGITRYAAAPGPSFAAAEPWLKVRSDLAAALDVAIDGNVYVLLPGGEIRRFAAGDAGTFAVGSVPGGLEGAVSLDASPTAGRVLVADTTRGRIVALGADGTFQAQHALPILPAAQPDSDDARGRIRALQGLFWDVGAGQLWWLSGPEVYRAGLRR